MDNTDNINPNSFYFNENCIPYSVDTVSELLQNDNVSFEYINASPVVDFIWAKRNPLIPSSISILPESITDESVFVTPCKIINRKHHVPNPLRNAF